MNVSVVIITYNRKELLLETVHSVLGQTMTDFEIIVVDDGSTDGTEAYLKERVSDPRVRYFWKENGGLGSARNFGIDKAEGEFLAFLDSDDLWEPEKLARQISVFLEFNDVDVVYTNYKILRGGVYNNEGFHFKEYQDLHRSLIRGNIIAGSASSVLIKKSSLGIDRFDESLFIAYEDVDLWRRLACKKLNFRYISNQDVIIRQHENQTNFNDTRVYIAGLKYVKKLRAEEAAYPAEVRVFVAEFYNSVIGWNVQNKASLKSIFKLFFLFSKYDRFTVLPYYIYFKKIVKIMSSKSQFLIRAFLIVIGVRWVYRLIRY